MKKKNVTKENIKVCLVGSSGGHLTHLYMLKSFWQDKDRFWVTFDKEDALSLLKEEKMYEEYINNLSNTQITVDSANMDCQIMKDNMNIMQVMKDTVQVQKDTMQWEE